MRVEKGELVPDACVRVETNGEPLAALLEVVHGADTFSDARSSATTAATAAGEPLEDRYASET